MKYIISLIFFVLIISTNEQGIAQRRHGYEGQQRPRPERLEKFRKMRLVEELKLNEDDAVRFFAKQNNHEEKIRELMEKRNNILDMMQKYLDEKGKSTELKKLSDDVMNLDRDIFSEKQRFQEEIRKLLTEEQFGKFMVFERDFGRKIREAMEEMRRGQEPKPEGDE